MATLLVQGLTLPWLVRKLGVKADTDAEHKLEHDLAVRAAKAARRRLKEIEATEELPEDISERLQRGALDIGVRISPDLLDDERREWWVQRAERVAAMSRVQREMMPPRGVRCCRLGTSLGLIPRWWTGCCGSSMCAAFAELRLGSGSGGSAWCGPGWAAVGWPQAPAGLSQVASSAGRAETGGLKRRPGWIAAGLGVPVLDVFVLDVPVGPGWSVGGRMRVWRFC